MATKDIDRVTITHNDSRQPDRVWLSIDGARGVGQTLNLSVHEAAELSERLLFAVRMSGYDLVARKRAR